MKTHRSNKLDKHAIISKRLMNITAEEEKSSNRGQARQSTIDKHFLANNLLSRIGTTLRKTRSGKGKA